MATADSELVSGDRRCRSWREKLEFVLSLLAREAPPITADQLVDVAVYLQWLGTRYLPAQQTLKIEVRDIDLAGELRPSRRHPPELRVARGGADWPRITLHYTLEADGKVLHSADETVQDMNYLHNLPTYDTADPLRYEKHMLQQWFRERFSGAY